MSYPDRLLRGIKSNDSIDEGGEVSATLFYFNSRESRGDGFKEESVNWNDDEGAIQFTLNMRGEDGEPRFKVGIAVVSREGIDEVKRWVEGILDYERNDLGDGNRYHGNLLLKGDCHKKKMQRIAGAIALHVKDIIWR